MIRLIHLSIPAPLSPDEAVAIWRALLVCILIFAAMPLALKWDARRERDEEGASRADAKRRIREFQTQQSHARRG